MARDAEILIAGGGIGGLCAAYELMKLGHDVIVRHACKIQSADQMIYAKRFHEALNLCNTILWISHNEAILTQ